MTPIYLYIEKYKALENQEIRLSTRYEVTKIKNDFRVEKKLDPHRYGENLDIAALFGQNGSGKSSAIEVLLAAIGAQDDFLDMNYLFIFEHQSCIYYCCNYYDEVQKYSVTFKNHALDKKSPVEITPNRHGVVYFSHQVEPLSNKVKFKKNRRFDYVDCSNQAFVSSFNLRSFKNKEIAACFDFLLSDSSYQFGINKVPMVATFGQIKEISSRVKNSFKLLLSQVDRLPEIGKERLYEELLSRFRNYKEGPLKSLVLHSLYGNNYEHSSQFSNDFWSILTTLLIHTTNRYSSELVSMNDLGVNFIRSINDFELLNSITKKFAKNFGKELYEEGKRSEQAMHYKKLLDFFDYYLSFCNTPNDYQELSLKSSMLSDLDLVFPHEESLSRYNYDGYERLSNFLNHSKKTKVGGETQYGVKSYEEFVWLSEFVQSHSNILKYFEVKWNGISSGQYSILTMFSRLFKYVQAYEQVTVIIDEGEVNLHPEWQRNYINDLVQFFNCFSYPSRINLILTSHSPFVLGDLYQESINILGKNNKKKLFASNIYELYSDGFLIKRTLGEFAFNKIRELSEKIDSRAIPSSIAEKLISDIGDEFVRQILKDKLRGDS